MEELLLCSSNPSFETGDLQQDQAFLQVCYIEETVTIDLFNELHDMMHGELMPLDVLGHTCRH